MREQTPGVGSAAGVRSAAGVGSAAGEGSAAGVGLTVGVRMEESAVKGSGCQEGPGCPGRPEVVGFSGVGPGVSSVLFLFRWLFLANSSKMCISAHPTASSLR